jgi:hypothetical protein
MKASQPIIRGYAKNGRLFKLLLLLNNAKSSTIFTFSLLKQMSIRQQNISRRPERSPLCPVQVRLPRRLLQLDGVDGESRIGNCIARGCQYLSYPIVAPGNAHTKIRLSNYSLNQRGLENPSILTISADVQIYGVVAFVAPFQQRQHFAFHIECVNVPEPKQGAVEVNVRIRCKER